MLCASRAATLDGGPIGLGLYKELIDANEELVAWRLESEPEILLADLEGFSGGA